MSAAIPATPPTHTQCGDSCVVHIGRDPKAVKSCNVLDDRPRFQMFNHDRRPFEKGHDEKLSPRQAGRFRGQITACPPNAAYCPPGQDMISVGGSISCRLRGPKAGWRGKRGGKKPSGQRELEGQYLPAAPATTTYVKSVARNARPAE